MCHNLINNLTIHDSYTLYEGSCAKWYRKRHMKETGRLNKHYYHTQWKAWWREKWSANRVLFWIMKWILSIYSCYTWGASLASGSSPQATELSTSDASLYLLPRHHCQAARKYKISSFSWFCHPEGHVWNTSLGSWAGGILIRGPNLSWLFLIWRRASLNTWLSQRLSPVILPEEPHFGC